MVGGHTFVATCSGFVHVTLVVDVHARPIAGWRVLRSFKTELVLDALKQTSWPRRNTDGLMHHIDAASRYPLMRYTERLPAAGIELSVGSPAD